MEGRLGRDVTLPNRSFVLYVARETIPLEIHMDDERFLTTLKGVIRGLRRVAVQLQMPQQVRYCDALLDEAAELSEAESDTEPEASGSSSSSREETEVTYGSKIQTIR